MSLVLLMTFLIADFDEWGKSHDDMLEKVLHICRQASLKPNKGKCLLNCTNTHFFDEVILWQGVSSHQNKTQVLADMPILKMKKELQSFFGILNCLSSFSPITAEWCEPLCRLTLVKRTGHRIEHMKSYMKK